MSRAAVSEPVPAAAGGPKWYTVPQVAVMIGVSRQHLYDLCHERAFPHLRVGDAIRISEEHIRMYRKKNECLPAPPPKGRGRAG